MLNQPPTVGRIVLYRLSGGDAATVNRRRTTGSSIAIRIEYGRWPLGAQAHIGDDVKEGDELPMLVTGVRTDEKTISGRVFLNGSDELFVSHVRADESSFGAWRWPPRV